MSGPSFGASPPEAPLHQPPPSPQTGFAPPVPPPRADDPGDVVGRRIGSGFIDLGVLFVVFILYAIVFGEKETSNNSVYFHVDGIATLGWLVVFLAYYGIQEAIWGTTLGKRILGLQVVTADGRRAGPGPVAGRTALRLIDVLPFAYLVGFIVMLCTPRKQRVGDLAAGTFVARIPRR